MVPACSESNKAILEKSNGPWNPVVLFDQDWKYRAGVHQGQTSTVSPRSRPTPQRGMVRADCVNTQEELKVAFEEHNNDTFIEKQ